MALQLIDPCYNASPITRDGVILPRQPLLLPFYGFWLPSGETVALPDATAPQAVGGLGGTQMIDNFSKDCCGGC